MSTIPKGCKNKNIDGEGESNMKREMCFKASTLKTYEVKILGIQEAKTIWNIQQKRCNLQSSSTQNFHVLFWPDFHWNKHRRLHKTGINVTECIKHVSAFLVCCHLFRNPWKQAKPSKPRALWYSCRITAEDVSWTCSCEYVSIPSLNIAHAAAKSLRLSSFQSADKFWQNRAEHARVTP